MKQTLIKINTDHYVIVNDSEIKEGNIFIHPNNVIERASRDLDGRGISKIIASTNKINGVIFLNLSEVKELIGEVDVEKKAELYVWGGVYLTEQEKQQTEIAYMTGYNQALEDNKEKKFTEEDLRNAYRHGTTVNHGTKEHFNSFIQSFQPKTEWEVTFDEQGKLRLV